MNSIQHITLIGAGNVASQLGKHLIKKNITITGVYNRTPEKGRILAQELNSSFIENLTFIPKNTDLVLICIADGAISEIINQIPAGFNIAYTSGSIQLENLPKRTNLGVFYPLQTFTKNKAIDLSKVPFFIESKQPELSESLFNLAKKISSHVYFASSEERFHLHIAAVMVNNFVNHLYTLASDYLASKQLNFDYLLPLIEETTSKLKSASPVEAQTGPAKRNDQAVIEKHLKELQGATKEIYALISKSIQETHTKNEL